MAGTFLQLMLRGLVSEMKWEVRRKIRNYIIGLIPEPLRKTVGLILLIFGVVVMLGVWLGSLFFGLIDYELVSIIAIIVSLGSILWGITLLRHKG